MANKKSCQRKDTSKQFGKTTTSDTHFQLRVRNISPPKRNHNSANHKSGQLQQRNLHTPYGSTKSQTFANSVHFTFGRGKSMQDPLPFDLQILITASF